MATKDRFDDAKIVAMVLFTGQYKEGEAVPAKTLEKILDTVLAIPDYAGVDRGRLRTELERRSNVVTGKSRILQSDRGHKAWLKERRSQIEWNFWKRYRWYLQTKKDWAPQVIDSLDETTDDILERLEDPEEAGRAFDRRGMVVGHVQSGKTANFTGLICKAVDAGYKIILVLAGQHNSLRSQTQLRLDEEFLGYDTAQFRRPYHARGQVGVALVPGEDVLPVQSLTTRQSDGDFRTTIASGMVVDLGIIPTILVVKKNGTVLKNVLRFFRENPKARPNQALNHNVMEDIPLLVIDDECDHASVNTKEVPVDEEGNRSDDYDPAKINQLIRSILRTFTQTAYVGYTATPFANIFIHSEDFHKVYGPDLFPDSFIISLPTPNNYSGPEEVFGLRDGSRERLPVVRGIDDFEAFIPDGHDKNWVPPVLCASLREALRAFLLASAIRRTRGQTTVHNSMLIHVTRFTDVQKIVASLITEELAQIARRIKYGDGDAPSPVRAELKHLWKGQFIPITKSMAPKEASVEWSTIEKELLPTIEKTKILTINGTTQDILDYKEHQAEGLNVIAIGGDKLSRGLTLEGLTISYYLRATKMYDTLMQMGRWFGYREGYNDLCRIYTTEELAGWYQDIAMASRELRDEFDAMVARGDTPRNYGLRVRSHPVLMVTSRVKMRDGETLDISYDGVLSESTVFDPSPAKIRQNLEHTNAFIRNLPRQEGTPDGYYRWSGVPGATVSKYLAGLQTHERAPKVNGRRLAEYIDRQIEQGELVEWTVALISRKSAEDDDEPEPAQELPTPIDVGGYKVTPVRRKHTKGQFKPGKYFAIKRVVSPSHEAIDLIKKERDEARRCTDGLAKKGRLDGVCIREARPRQRGLLLIYPLDPNYLTKRIQDEFPAEHIKESVIGFAVSFPKSPSAVPIQYRVNNVFWNQEYGTT